MIIYLDIDDDVLHAALTMADKHHCPVAIILNDAVREYTRVEPEKVWQAEMPLEERQKFVANVIVENGVATETYQDGSRNSGPVGESGIVGPIGVPSDGSIYAEVSRRRSDAADLELQDHEDALRKMAHNSLSQANVATADEAIPAWARVRDGQFVNAYTGNALGHEFDLKWGARVAEFAAFVEGEAVPVRHRNEHDQRGWQPK